MKNSTLTSTLKNIELWPKSKRVRILELILLLLLLGTAGYAGATHKTPKPVAPTAPVSFNHTTNPTPNPASAPVVAPAVAAVTPVVVPVVQPAVTTTTTTDTTGGQGGAEAPVVLPSGITGATEVTQYNPDTEQNELQPQGGDTFNVTQDGNIIASVTSGADGTFQLDLDPGTYTIVPTTAFPSPFPYATQDVTVVSEQYTNVIVTYTFDLSHLNLLIKN